MEDTRLARRALAQALVAAPGEHDLAECGARIDRSGGVSCGPVGFLDLFATSAQVNRTAGRRPGAHLAVLRDDHPDALEFVRAKRGRPEALRGLGLALSLRDATLAAARRPGSREAALLDALAAAVHESGEPSVLFPDAIARANPVPGLEPPRATNPCGEQPLLPGESCVLGSRHLPAETEPREIARLIRLAHRLGCKGVALYRRGSHEPAVLRGEPAPDLELPAEGERAERARSEAQPSEGRSATAVAAKD